MTAFDFAEVTRRCLDAYFTTFIFMVFTSRRKDRFILRIFSGFFAYLAFCIGENMLIVAIPEQIPTVFSQTIRYSLLLAENVLFVLSFKFAFDLSWDKLLYRYVLASAGGNVVGIVFGKFVCDMLFEDISSSAVLYVLYRIATNAVSTLLLFAVFGKNLKPDDDVLVGSKAKSVALYLAIVFFLTVITICSYILYYGTQGAFRYISFIGLTFIAALIIIVLYSIVQSNQLRLENSVTRRLWQHDRAHYEIRKESIDSINVKCHDLKKQINLICAEGKIDGEAVKSIQRSIEDYECVVETGNETLDVILTDVALRCRERKIPFHYMADGKALSFMERLDIYALFGNILDNAVERQMKENVDKRNISFELKYFGSSLLIRCSNCFTGKLSFRDGMPITDKTDKENHGFGIKSIRQIVEKYGGTMNVKAENESFKIGVILPIPKKKTTEENEK